MLGLIFLIVFSVNNIVAGARQSIVEDSSAFKKPLYVPVDNSARDIEKKQGEQPIFSISVNRKYLLFCCEQELLHPDENHLEAVVWIRTCGKGKTFTCEGISDKSVQKIIGVLNFTFSSTDDNLTHKFVLPKNLRGKKDFLYKISLYLLHSSCLGQHICVYKNRYPLDYIVDFSTRVPESRCFAFDFYKGASE